MLVDEKRVWPDNGVGGAERIVTCPRDNGINKAGRASLLVPPTVLPLCRPDFAGIGFTDLLRLLRFSDRSGRAREALRLPIQNPPNERGD